METPIDPEKLATVLAQAAADTKALDIEILDMRGLVDYTDMFILCSGRNSRQVAAIATAVREAAKTQFELIPMGVEGMSSGKWVLVDFGDAVVHVFDQAMRGFYNLDGLWADAPHLEAPSTGLEDDDETAEEPRFFR
ncbi:MAG: ribosome silencing factor [Myxococcota bacterium]